MFKNHLKGGLKVLGDYLAGLLIYFILLYTFIAITGDKFSEWLPVYSLVMFLLTALIIYSDMWGLAEKEKKPQYQLDPYPLKGLVLGFIGFSPLIIIQLVALFLNFKEPVFNSLKTAILQNILLGPLYFSLNLFGKTVIAHIITSLIIPILCMISYLMGFYGIEIKKAKKRVEVERKQELSPWNPARIDSENAKNKKRKKKKKSEMGGS